MNPPAAVTARRMPAKCQDQVYRCRRSNPVAAPARMPATSPASASAPDPAATSPEAAASPVVEPAPPGTQEAGNEGTVWNTINPGVEAAGRRGEHNILREVPGPTAYEKHNIDECALSAFHLLIDMHTLQDPAATSPEAAASPVVEPAPPGTQEAGNEGTVWNTINPGVEAADHVFCHNTTCFVEVPAFLSPSPESRRAGIGIPPDPRQLPGVAVERESSTVGVLDNESSHQVNVEIEVWKTRE
ncbi:UNVERIFIED_CONTAM: hypothetical protein FKN15_040137 [Acipenser sinensis]